MCTMIADIKHISAEYEFLVYAIHSVYTLLFLYFYY